MLLPTSRRRTDLAEYVCAIIGTDAISLKEVNTGWPSRAVIKTATSSQPISMHVALAGSHSRASYERRFQNPATSVPVQSVAGSLPLLIGVPLSSKPILIVVDGRSRVGRIARFSILFNERLIADAQNLGWATYISNTGETIYGLVPQLLPVLVEALNTGVFPTEFDMTAAVLASGMLDDASQSAVNRMRRVASMLVRSAKFSRDVRIAYDERCGMCGLDADLVEGAHILPVSAPHSQDKVWNGIALCRNHHRLYDTFRVWVRPDDFAIRLHQSVLEKAKIDPSVAAFAKSTRPALVVPAATMLRPRKEMLIARQEYFKTSYEWL